jgi:uncharacterized membrane-anchored protein
MDRHRSRYRSHNRWSGWQCRRIGGEIMRSVAILAWLATLSVLTVCPATAQRQSAPVQEPSQQAGLWAQIERLDWKFGPTQGSIAGVAAIAVPQGSVFLGSAGTRRFLELQGNLGEDNTYTFAPGDLRWFAAFSFDESGYVQDDEKIDPVALLEILKRNNASGNEERQRRGLQTLVLEDWYIVPHYDVQTKRLEWGTKLRQASGDITVNYTIRLLGRSGVMRATLVSEPASLDQDIRTFKAGLTGFEFNQGQRYSEFRSGDKVAEYGLAALIVGGAAAAAAKSGAFKAIGKFVAFGVFGGLAAAWAAIKSFFSRKRANA